MGLPLRRQLASTVEELLNAGRAAASLVRSARTDPEVVPRAQQAVQAFRRRYTQVEVTLDFFGDAVNSRTSRSNRAALQALDRLAAQSMEAVLQPLNMPVPPVLTYIDKGLGASILRAGVRLWSPGRSIPSPPSKWSGTTFTARRPFSTRAGTRSPTSPTGHRR